MFRHQKELQFEVKVDRPDPKLARAVQEVLGGQFGEMTVMMQYLFQGFNCRGNEKYKDMLMDIGTEEIGHVEMLCSLISQLLDGASPDDQAEAAKDPCDRRNSRRNESATPSRQWTWRASFQFKRCSVERFLHCREW